MSPHELQVGAARVDITPDYGTQISGDIGRYRPVEQVRDRLYARVIVLRSGSEAACLISCDMACISQNHSRPLRAEIAAALNTSAEAVMIHCVQSHSAARVGGMFDDPEGVLAPDLWWVRGETPAYNDLFFSAIRSAVQQAQANLTPVTARYARTLEGRCAFNRRFIMRDGTAKTHPGYCNPDVLHVEGPVDPEASLLLFEAPEGRPVAALLHYTCHPTHGYPHRYISADWPGLWSEAVREKLGGECVVACLNGACGNISPNDHTSTDYDGRTNLGLMVRRLGQTADTLLANLQPLPAAPLQAAGRVLRIPWNQPAPEALAAARRLLAEHPRPIFLDEAQQSIAWDWVFALRDLDKAHKLRSSPEYDFEIQVVRVGEMIVVGWPGEPFVEAQLEVKLNAHPRPLMLAHECNDECGYLPTLAAAQRGGYEAWGKLPPGTLERVAAETSELIGGL